MADVSPTKWHRAHVTWFFETFVLGRTPRATAPTTTGSPTFSIRTTKALGDRHPRAERGHISRPGIARSPVTRVRDEAMGELLNGELEPGVPTSSPSGSTRATAPGAPAQDIKNVLSRNPLHPAYMAPTMKGNAPPPPRAGWLEHEGGVAEIGHGDRVRLRQRVSRHPVYLSPFALADRPVTCGDWISFMDDDGYRRPSSGSPTVGRSS